MSVHDFGETAHTNFVKMKRLPGKTVKVPGSYRISMPDAMWRECPGEAGESERDII